MAAAPDILVYSAEKGRQIEVQRLLHAGDTTQLSKDRALLKAVENNHLSIIDYLLNNGSNARSQPATQALSVIARSGELKLVWDFLKHGAQATTWAAIEVLHEACLQGDLALVRQLIVMNAAMDPKVAGKALLKAAGNGHLEVVRSLLMASRDGKCAVIEAETAGFAMKEAAMNEAFGVVQLLMDAGVDSGAALKCAGAKGKRGICNKLMDMGAIPSRGLAAAASSGNIKCVRDVLNRGVEPQAGASALKEASRFGFADIAKELLKIGVDPKCDTAMEALRLAMTARNEAQEARVVYEARVNQIRMWEDMDSLEEGATSVRMAMLWKKELACNDTVQAIRRAQDPNKHKKGLVGRMRGHVAQAGERAY